MLSLAERFWTKVDQEAPTDCWEWRGTRTNKGYGRIYDAGRWTPAHRLSYTLKVGPIPEGLVIDHLCRNRGCVNPSHLEPVTNAENLRRGVSFSALNSQKTHCPQGHEYDEANTRWTGTKRHCRACGRAHAARKWRRLHGAAS